MLFYTVDFLVFSLVLLAILAFVHRDEPRKIVLLIASYVFYMWWNPAFIALIIFATAVNYLVSLRIERETDDGERKKFLLLGLVASLGLLGYFKYAGFLVDNTLYLMRMMGFDVHWTTIEITLPVGISFYTFQTLSYTLDVYRRKIPATRSPTDFALFVAFFPQLVAGPIVRASDFLPQLRGPIRVFCDQNTFFLILRGLAKKVLVADNIAVLADRIFSDPQAYPSIIIWVGAIAFAIQIYCDFSGYSDIAIGVSRVLGFRLPLNFDHPYLARNPSDFWRRWHISLSSWLRDYLYVSMGGNRKGRIRTYLNLMVTMLLGGLWHGASWNFVLWGLLHGFILVVHRLYGDLRKLDPNYRPSRSACSGLLSIIATQYCVLVAWIAFRISDVAPLRVALTKFIFFDFNFSIAGIGVGSLSFFSSLLIIAIFLGLHLISRHVGMIDRYLGSISVERACLICALLGLSASLLWPASDVPFIYFQF